MHRGEFDFTQEAEGTANSESVIECTVEAATGCSGTWDSTNYAAGHLPYGASVKFGTGDGA